MSGSSVTLCPLASVKEADLKKLCQTLWDWEYCNRCNNEKPCRTSTCPWQRSKKLEPFFEFYRNATAWSIPEVPGGGYYALRDHDDLFSIILLIKEKPDVPRSLLTEEYFSKYDRKPDVTDQQRAFNLAIKIMDMLNCPTENQSLDGLELGSGPTTWGNDKTHHEFIEATFPAKDHPILCENGGRSDIKRQLNATQLRKVARIKFQGTDDLKSHLSLDPNIGVVHIFHHMTFLREYLLATRDDFPASDGVSREIIPRQLALETHDSLQILFPLGHESRKVLMSLASQDGFDFDDPAFGRMDYRREEERKIRYRYWGTRLLDLHAELNDPRPRRISQWVQARTKERHFMIAAIAGVLFAVLSLAVGIFQAWVAYQQWKYPATGGNL